MGGRKREGIGELEELWESREDVWKREDVKRIVERWPEIGRGKGGRRETRERGDIGRERA